MSYVNMMKRLEPRCVQICRKKLKKGKVAVAEGADIVKVLPDELIEEILLRLPLKSIVSSGCVCKSWYSLIRSRNFVSTHFHKTTKTNVNNNKNPQVFLYKNESRKGKVVNQKKFSYIFHTPPDHQLDYRVIRLPVGLDHPLFSTFAVANSINGIVCLFDLQYCSYFILSNPSIRHSLLLPLPPKFMPFAAPLPPKFMPFAAEICSKGILGFGFDYINHDYKILRIVKTNNNHHWDAQLYSLKLNCWKDILAPIPNFHLRTNERIIVAPFVNVNGRFHWFVQDGDDNTNIMIMVFDLKEEAFHYLPLPNSLSQLELQSLRIAPFWESSIMLLQQEETGSFDWVMRQYGDVGSWQPLTKDEKLESIFRCPRKDIKQEFFEILRPSRHSLHTYVPSLELLDIQRLQY